ncbi:MAG TPA: DUF192 domain-containing protein [Stellaceae bacterium]|nr:DUF192 domain-containing protein [Stellaceae bacterium]
MTHVRALLLAAFLALVALSARAQLQHFETGALTIDSRQGPTRFSVEMAMTPAQQEQGLMFRRSLPAGAGMLFVFPETQVAVFWMKNTLIPLDMLFIAADGHVADIHERAVPMSEANIVSKVPVKAVLELNGGTAARLGIKDGDLVHSTIFGTAG